MVALICRVFGHDFDPFPTRLIGGGRLCVCVRCGRFGAC